MNRKITNVAVIGSGIMGSRIACHFANIGVQVLLLDILKDLAGLNVFVLVLVLQVKISFSLKI